MENLEGRADSTPTSPEAEPRREKHLEDMLENIRKLYETTTKLVIEKRVYGSPADLRSRFEKWLAEHRLSSLGEASSEDEGCVEESSEDDLYMGMEPLNSEEEPIYEDMAPRKEAPQETVSERNIQEVAEAASRDSKCCLNCVCVNVIKAGSTEGEEE